MIKKRKLATGEIWHLSLSKCQQQPQQSHKYEFLLIWKIVKKFEEGHNTPNRTMKDYTLDQERNKEEMILQIISPEGNTSKPSR